MYINIFILPFSPRRKKVQIIILHGDEADSYTMNYIYNSMSFSYWLVRVPTNHCSSPCCLSRAAFVFLI